MNLFVICYMLALNIVRIAPLIMNFKYFHELPTKLMKTK